MAKKTQMTKQIVKQTCIMYVDSQVQVRVHYPRDSRPRLSLPIHTQKTQTYSAWQWITWSNGLSPVLTPELTQVLTPVLSFLSSDPMTGRFISYHTVHQMTHVDKCAISVVADGDGIEIIKWENAKVQKCRNDNTIHTTLTQILT